MFDCRRGFSLADGQCYMLTDRSMSRDQAEETCRKVGGHLARFPSEQEARWATASYLRIEHMNNERVWLDGRPGAARGLGPKSCVTLQKDHTYAYEVPCAGEWYYGLCMADATPAVRNHGAEASTTLTISVSERFGSTVRTVEYIVDTASVHSPGATAAAVHRALVVRLPIAGTHEQTSHDGLSPHERAIAERDREADRSQQQITSHLGTISQLDSEVNRLHQVIVEREGEEKRLQHVVTERETAIATRDSEVQRLQQDVSSHQKTIAERDSEVADHKKTIAERDREVADYKATISRRESEEKGLQQNVTSLNTTLHGLKQVICAHETTIASLQTQLSAAASQHRDATRTAVSLLVTTLLIGALVGRLFTDTRARVSPNPDPEARLIDAARRPPGGLSFLHEIVTRFPQSVNRTP
jgi:peptidoglycan hydrolase CwlO-like protein